MGGGGAVTPFMHNKCMPIYININVTFNGFISI